MASPTNPIGEDQIYNLKTSGSIPSWLKKEGDISAQLIYLTRDINKFAQMLHTRFPKTKQVPTQKFEYSEIMELERYYTVQVSSETGGTTYHTKFGLTNNEAAQIQPNDILFFMDIFTTCVYQEMISGQVIAQSGGTQGTNVGPDLGQPVGANPTAIKFSNVRGAVDGYYFNEYESARVLRVFDADSAGTGYTYVEVDRCYHAPHSMDRGGMIVPRSLVYSANGIGGAGTAAYINVGTRVIRGTPAFEEGSGAPDGLYKNPHKDNNFAQLWKYAYSATLESEINDKLLGTDPYAIQKWLLNRRTNRDKEFMYLFNRKGMYITPDGKTWYSTGGVVEFVPKDDDHYIIYPAASLNWPSLLDMGKRIFSQGGSAHRYWHVGYSLDAELRKMFYNDGHMRFEPALSKEFNIEVNSIYMSGGKISIIPNQVMEEVGFGKIALSLDMDYANTFVPVTVEGWDYREEKNIATPGFNIKKNMIQGMIGLERRYRLYHSIVDFSGVR